MKDRLFGFSGKRFSFDFQLKYFYQIITILGTVCMALGGDFIPTFDESVKIFCSENSNCILAYVLNNIIIFIIGMILALWGIIGAKSDNEILQKNNDELKKDIKKFINIEKDLKSLKEENVKLIAQLNEKNEEIVKNWLKMISSEMNLNTYERLSIYYESNEEFTILSRFSQNTLYDKIHNNKFPLNQGVISKSWQHNEFIENNCPLYNENSKRNYINYMKKNYGYTEDRLNKLTMKSDKLYGIAVQIAEDNIGVILYEKISIGEKDFNDKCAMLKQKSNRYANYLTKYIQQAIKFDRSINLKNKNLNTRAEDGLFQTFKEGK